MVKSGVISISISISHFRFFLGREVPRESLVFMIRALGGEASWDEMCAPGATFKQGDSQVTHQVGKCTPKSGDECALRDFHFIISRSTIVPKSLST